MPGAGRAEPPVCRISGSDVSRMGNTGARRERGWQRVPKACQGGEPGMASVLVAGGMVGLSAQDRGAVLHSGTGGSRILK